MATSERTINQDKSVLVLSLAKYYGGAEVRVLQLARLLHGHKQIRFAILKDSLLHKQFLKEGLSCITLDYNKADPRLVIALKSLLKKHQIQVIDTHNPQSHFWGLIAAKLAGVNHIITTVHGNYGEAETGFKSWFYEAILRLNHYFGSNFIAVSDSVNTYLNRLKIANNKIQMIPNAMAKPELSEQGQTINQLCGWEDDALIIAITARLEPVKGIDSLIKAFAIASKECSNLKLCIIGTGRSQQQLEKQASELKLGDAVHFTGFRQDIFQLLKSADIFCLPSLSEGLPYAVLEAALCELPLALSHVGGMEKLFSDNKTALFFPPDNPAEQAEVLMQLAGDKLMRKRLGTAAQQLVSQHFSPEKMLQAVLTTYNRTIS